MSSRQCYACCYGEAVRCSVADLQLSRMWDIDTQGPDSPMMFQVFIGGGKFVKPHVGKFLQILSWMRIFCGQCKYFAHKVVHVINVFFCSHWMLNICLCTTIQKCFSIFFFFLQQILDDAQSPDPEDFVCDICRASISYEQQLVKHRQIHSQSWWPSTRTRASGNNSLVSPPWRTLIDMHLQNSSEALNHIFGSKFTTPSKFQNTFRDEENSSPHSNQFLTPTKYQSPTHSQTPSKFPNPKIFQSPMQSQDASSPLEIDLLAKKKLTDSPKVIAKSQQKLITCTFCFLSLATEKLLNAHLLEKHQFADTGSRNSNSVSRYSNDSVNNVPDHETVVKMEPGTSPPILGSQQKYKCSKCNYRNVYDEVKQHQRTLHTDCEFMCDYTLCTYLFTTANGLRKHMFKNHGQTNPFVVKFVSKYFSSVNL